MVISVLQFLRLVMEPEEMLVYQEQQLSVTQVVEILSSLQVPLMLINLVDP